MLRIDIDTREHENKNLWILDYFFANGVSYRYVKLDTGDYRLFNDDKILIDRKSGIMEIANNLLSSEHERFKREILRSIETNSKFYILIEDENISCIDEVANFQIPVFRTTQYKDVIDSNGNIRRICCHKKGEPRAKFSPLTLSKVMKTQEQKYGIKYVFAKHLDIPKIIITILKGEYND